MLVGRDVERARLAAVVDGARRSASGVLVLRGEAGVGKSTLLEEAVGRAPDLAVLRARGVESESELPFAALHQLLRPALAGIDQLAAPQSEALRCAFGLQAGRADQRFLVSLAVLSLLADLAERRPVLCVLDDAQWIDHASLDALAFVARRLSVERIGMLFAVRDTAPFPAGDLPALCIGGLDDDAAAAVLGGVARVRVPSDVGGRLTAATGGNPLALVELARALTAEQLAGGAALPDPLPVAASVEQAFLAQVRRLSAPTQTVLLVAAVDDSGVPATVLAAAARLGVGVDAFAAAERAGVIQVDKGVLRFRHPLVRSAVYQGATFPERQAAHRELAAVLDPHTDADRRAWHRAAAAGVPDDDVVDELVAAAARARDRGAFPAAARAMARAAELTAVADARGRRLTEAAYHAWRGGQLGPARALLEKARPLVVEPVPRADVDRLRGMIEASSGVATTACRLLREAAVRVAPHDAGRALEMLAIAAESASMALDHDAVVDLGRVAEGLQVGDRAERFLAELLIGFGRQFAGDLAAATGPLGRAVELAGGVADPRRLLLAWRAALYAGDDAAAHRLSLAAVERARETGDVAAVTSGGVRLALSEVLAGRWAAASATVDEAARLAEAAGQTDLMPLVRVWGALVDALRGDAGRCRATVGRALAVAAELPMGLVEDGARWALAVLDLGAGEAASASGRLSELRHPLVLGLSALDRVEAAAQAGEQVVAVQVCDELDAVARATARPWALARAAHAHGLLADGPAAEVAFAEALGHEHARPFERARTELAYGAWLRRARRRGAARPHLRLALDRFERLGAAPWAERARVELRACGHSVREREGAAAERLTPQELQVARFVAQGLSNAEVAAQLFLSRRTIDFHLRNVFAKLGISARTELVRWVVAEERAAAS